MELLEKLTILADAAKYDVACTSSGADRAGVGVGMGSAAACGICHSFAADGRCISLLKVLQSNACAYDCEYCANRCSRDTRRATFTPRELADLTVGFYRRNYIEGLFLSSAVVGSPDHTCEQMIKTLEILRHEYHFSGYIHVKAIPGADPVLINRLGLLAERMSVNIELPSRNSLGLLAPQKSAESILRPMGQIAEGSRESSRELVKYRHAPAFVPAGQSTQMMVGASPESDFQILKLAEGLYHKYSLKRVFFSAYVPIVSNPLLPSLDTKPPLLREHRLYQADWLLRFYGFKADELLDADHPNFHPLVDPKCSWALNHPEFFPVEINRASQEELLRVPGIGPIGVRKILQTRRFTAVDFEGLRRLGVVLKRAQYFITCNGRSLDGLRVTPDRALADLLSRQGMKELPDNLKPGLGEQLSFLPKASGGEDYTAWLN